MRTLFIRWCKNLWRAEFFSPKGFLARALGLGLLYGLCCLAGLREYTTFFSGTPAAANIGWAWTAILGLVYTLAYLGFVLMAPILVIGAVILKSLLWVAALSGRRADERGASISPIQP